MYAMRITLLCIVATLIVLGVLGYALFELGMPGQLNEIGDSIAGFAGALAFIWLVGGYFLQQNELRQTRAEYEGMRKNMERQSTVLSREDCVNGARLHLAALDNAAESFHAQCKIVHRKVFGGGDIELQRMYAFGYLARKTDQEAARNPSVTDKMRHYIQPLNTEVRRYVQAFEKLDGFLEEAEHGAWVRTVLVDGSIYKDVLDRIREARTRPGAVGEIFDH